MKNEQFERDIQDIPELFRKLAIGIDGDEKILQGALDVVDASGKLWETYQIEIRGSESYPYAFPKLFETAEAFPKTADLHVYDDEKSCCLDIKANEIILCKAGLGIADYITRFAIPYFANQSYRMREGYYLYGEYSHGIYGTIEYYQGKLKAKNPTQLIAMLDLIMRDYNPARGAYCPFCLTVKFRHCHRNVFTELQGIKDFIWFEAATRLIPFFKANPNYRLPKAHILSF